jgi:hypothetical protein
MRGRMGEGVSRPAVLMSKDPESKGREMLSNFYQKSILKSK